MSIERILEEGISTYGRDYLDKLKDYMTSDISLDDFDIDIEGVRDNGKENDSL